MSGNMAAGENRIKLTTLTTSKDESLRFDV
jgi:hypothetical protein